MFHRYLRLDLKINHNESSLQKTVIYECSWAKRNIFKHLLTFIAGHYPFEELPENRGYAESCGRKAGKAFPAGKQVKKEEEISCGSRTQR